MPDDPGPQGSAESDLFGRWLAHRDAASDAPARDRTRPPSWAPPAVAPARSGDAAPPELPETYPAPAVPREPQPDAAPAPRSSDSLHGPDESAGPDESVRPDESVKPEESVRPDESVKPEESAEPSRANRRRAQGPAEAPVRMTFRPRTRARAAVGIGAILAATASVIGTWVAVRDRDTASVGIAVTLWVLTGIIWAVHSGTSVTRLSVRGGQLQVLQHGVRTTIDLTSSYTPVEVHGRPGRHGWKVVFRRRDLSPFVIDQSMVDPNEFMRVLRYYRPGVDAGE